MPVNPHPADVKQIVIDLFVTLGAELSALSDLHISLRIERGRCVARNYRVEGLMAMWLIDYGIVQFYDAAGNMLHTVNLLEDVRPQRLAA